MLKYVTKHETYSLKENYLTITYYHDENNMLAVIIKYDKRQKIKRK